ncbi:unnamed protein product [Rotaria sp. Silwood1]|nr:unnamed protein product [Rotaria sp. Silwood1]
MLYRCILLSMIIFDACCFLYCIKALLSFNSNSISYDFSHINKSIRHTAIILAKIPSIKVLKHLNALVKVGINAFVMCDEEPSKYINSTNRILYVSNEHLAQYGISLNLVWDRVFVWLYNQSWIDYVWLIEDDVTWSNIHHIVDFFNRYANNSADLLSKSIIYRNNQTLK